MRYLGFLYIGLILLPNIIYAVLKPNIHTENKLLNIFEKAGAILIIISLLISDDFNINYRSNYTLLLILSFILMLMYECFWIRYFFKGRKLVYLYGSFLGIPLAGAVLPIASFFILGIYSKNIWLIVSDMIFAVPHIKISIINKRELK